MKLQIVDYKLYDYEIEFLKKEISKFNGRINGKIGRNEYIEVEGLTLENALMLTYIKGVIDNDNYYSSKQHLREHIGNGKRTQSKRYGPHSLHEYKGRYNPQMPRSLILSNFTDTRKAILDPFMGSGTTLIEARGLGYKSIGVELNPFAYLITRAKKFFEEINFIPHVNLDKTDPAIIFSNTEKEYLKKWFPEGQLKDLELILSTIESILYSDKEKLILKVILSNLLREHSLQDPRDLRIRRRLDVPNGLKLKDSFLKSLQEYRLKHEEWMKVLGKNRTSLSPIHGDSTKLRELIKEKVQGTVCSPPYVSALPYVDTYRLSMVALGIIKPSEIIPSERSLIGARDVSKEDEIQFNNLLSSLPTKVKNIAKRLFKEVESDRSAGFRKKAVPFALVKYAFLMRKVLKELYLIEQAGAKNYWVLGPNKVNINSTWYYINTPEIVGNLAESVGFKKIKLETVQSYQRYNIHSKNSIDKEDVLIFEKND